MVTPPWDPPGDLPDLTPKGSIWPLGVGWVILLYTFARARSME